MREIAICSDDEQLLRRSAAARRPTRLALLASLAALSLLPGCLTIRAVPDSVSLSAPTVEIPIERLNGVFFVDALIEGQGPYRLVLDTGAGMLTLRPEVIDEIGLEARRFPWRMRGASETRWGWRRSGRVAELTIGDQVTIRSFRYVEHDLPLSVDGLIGNGILDHCAMLVDPLQQRIWLSTEPTTPHPDDVPLRLSHGVPTIEIVCGERTVRAPLDSGCSGTLDLPLAQEEKIPLEPGGTAVQTYSIHGSHWLKVRRYDGVITVGPLEIPHPLVRFGSGHPLVGLPLFHGAPLRIDLRTKTLQLGPSVILPTDEPDALPHGLIPVADTPH